ncbi:family 1 glycosylhydrolase, partial [Streptomyces turgidiscabies]|uniref:family 1 glycosylhydrolase n=1 Tax=Streptomyces turgidiscabies TaxID=85558 RepID=UPI0038F6843B
RMHFNFDFIGIQNYFALTVKYNALIPYVHANEVKASSRKVPHTDLGWEINADSFYRMIKRFWLYGSVKNIMITESGACFRDKLVAG